MTARTPSGAVVVGVDSSADGDLAVEWALAHASRTHQPVHLVHISARPLPPAHSFPGTRTVVEEAEGADTVLEESLAVAHGVKGVTAERVVDPLLATGEALVLSARDASMLVVGARGHSTLTGLLMGSVSQYAAQHATCPVVVVRKLEDLESDRIVVGVDDSDGAQDALAFAFELASHSGIGVTAVHAWQAVDAHFPGVVLPMPMPIDIGAQLAEEYHLLGNRLERWQQKYPDVPVTPVVTPGHPASVLTHASAHATLVVVGSRGRGALRGMLLGSVSQAVLHHARCPVAVAH